MTLNNARSVVSNVMTNTSTAMQPLMKIAQTSKAFGFVQTAAKWYTNQVMKPSLITKFGVAALKEYSKEGISLHVFFSSFRMMGLLKV